MTQYTETAYICQTPKFRYGKRKQILTGFAAKVKKTTIIPATVISGEKMAGRVSGGGKFRTAAKEKGKE